MSSLFDLTRFLDTATCVRLAVTLLHFLWQGTVIGLVVLAVNHLRRRDTARLRYGVNVCAMFIMAACAPLTFALVSVDSRRPEETVNNSVSSRSDLGATEAPATVELTVTETTVANAGLPVAEFHNDRQPGDIGISPRETAGTGAPALLVNGPGLAEQARILAPILTVIWLAGVLIMLGRLMLALWGGRRLQRASQRIHDSRLLDMVRTEAKRIGLRAAPHVAACTRTTVPVVVGILRPTILLPASLATGLAPDQLQAILAHELAHIRRHDLVVNLLQRLIESILFFHPAVWYVSRCIRHERENCCDDRVVAAGHETLQYAGALVRMAELCGSKHGHDARRNLTALAASGDQGTQLKRRVLRLLDAEPRLRLMPVGSLTLFIAIVLTGGIGLWQISDAGQTESVVSVAEQSSGSESDEATAGESPDSVAEETVETPVPPAGHVSVLGRVVDAAGEPIQNARVLLRAASTPSVAGLVAYADVFAETTTDADGRFVFDRAPVPGEMEHVVGDLLRQRRGADVVVQAEGFGLSWAPLYSAENPDEVAISLNDSTTLDGVVRADGAGVAGAEVTVHGISLLSSQKDNFLTGPGHVRLYSSSLRPRATTDDQGRFRIDGLPVDCRVYLRVIHPAYQQGYLVAVTSDELPADDVSTDPDARPVQISPVKVDLVTGLQAIIRVVDEDGDPVSEGRTVLITGGREWNRELDDDGTSTFVVADAGEYTVLYLSGNDAHPGLLISRTVKIDEFTADTPLEVTLKLPRWRWVEGRVTGRGTNNGIPRVSVRLSSQQDSEDGSGDRFFSRALTGPDGAFRLRGVPGRGRVSMSGTPEGHFIAGDENVSPRDAADHEQEVDIPAAGFMEQLVLEVSRGLVLRGAVRDADGDPVPAATIRAESLGIYGPRLRLVTSDDAGRFEIAGLNPREDHMVSANTAAGVAVVTVPGDESHALDSAREVAVSLDLRSSVTVRGRVLLAGEPCADMPLTLLRGQPVDAGVRFLPIDTTTTDDNGNYELSGLQPDDHYHIDMNPPVPAVDPEWTHQSPFAQTLSESAAGEVVLPDANLIPLTQTLAGIVEDPDGNPVAGASVSAQLKGGRSLFRTGSVPPPWTKTDEEGRFRLTHLPDQEIQLMAYIAPTGPDLRIRFPARVECELNQQDVKILLDPSLLEED